MAEPNDELIQRFYAAFARHDGGAMAECYAPDARFDDPVFPGLQGTEPGLMWEMLTSRADDLELELLEHSAQGDTGSARWRAEYTFSQTGRKVVNKVSATFRFENGLIAEHRDQFSFYRWARQAFGFVGLTLGWTPFLRSAVRRRSRAALDEYIERG